MTHPFSPAGDGEPAGSAPGATAAPGRAAGGTGPGVPLSIWPGLPEPGGTRDGGPVTVAAARRVIDTFSVPGDLVAAAGGCSSAVAEAAAAAGRRVLVLVPDGSGGYPLPVPYPVARLRPGGPALVLAPGNPVTGQAALAVAGCCGSGCCAGPGAGGQDGQDAGLLFAACERVLRPGGVLAVIAGPAADGGALTDTAGSVVAAARAAGLVYAQHIVLVRAEIDGDRLAPAGGADAPGGSPVHDDLLVLTKPGGEARS